MSEAKVEYLLRIFERWKSDFDEDRALNNFELDDVIASLKLLQSILLLPSEVLKLCNEKKWSLHWTARGAYLHLESSELIEAIRGKHGDPVCEAADVLIVLSSITENHGIAWQDVIEAAYGIVDNQLSECNVVS